MKQLRYVVPSLLLAACPSSPGETTLGTETGSQGDGSSDETNSEATQTTPADPTTTNDPGTSTDTPGSESMSGPDTEPETSTSTGPAPQCVGNDECDGATPFCVDGTCAACDATPDPDMACSELSGGDLPVCGDDAACHECKVNGGQCTGTTPVCDEELLECVGCSEHEHCPDSACNLESGVCNDINYVLYVDRLAADCMVGDGTQAMPYCKIAEALTETATEPGAAWTIKVRAGNYLEEPLVIPNDMQITLVGWDGVPKLRAYDDSGATLTISSGAKVFLGHVQFQSNDFAQGVDCEGATVFADDTGFQKNTKEGFRSTDCTATFNRCVFYDNDGGGIAAYGAGTTKIVNSYVTGNGSQNFGDFGGIRSAQENKLLLFYSTVLNNLSMSGPRSLHCTDDAFPAEIRNSVIIAFAAPSVDCAAGMFSNSVLDEGANTPDILVATMADIANFFEPMVQGVYKAKAGTAMEGIAKWLDGDPKRDYDGQKRPGTDGDLDWPGADIPAE